MRAQGIALQAGYAVAAGLILAVARISPPPARLDDPAAAAAGLALAAGLYLVLAGGRVWTGGTRLLVLAVVAGATEEVVWRWGILAGAAPLLGWSGALAVSTLGFAYRHTRSEKLVAYLVLGASFGGVFLATGRLVAAIAAHAGYNALVLLRGAA